MWCSFYHHKHPLINSCMYLAFIYIPPWEWAMESGCIICHHWPLGFAWPVWCSGDCSLVPSLLFPNPGSSAGIIRNRQTLNWNSCFQASCQFSSMALSFLIWKIGLLLPVILVLSNGMQMVLVKTHPTCSEPRFSSSLFGIKGKWYCFLL